MKVEIALVISAASFIVALVVGISSMKRNNTKDTSAASENMGRIMEKLDYIGRETRETRDTVNEMSNDVVELRTRLKQVEHVVFGDNYKKTKE